MKIFKNKAGQGATEYLLILAAVLVVIAIAVYFITRTSVAKPNILLAVSENSTGNGIRVHAVGGTDNCRGGDWQYAIYAVGGSQVWTPGGTTTLAANMADLNLTATSGTLTAGNTYVVRIQHIPSGQYFVDTTVSFV
jgi:hypothetical protein